MRLLVILFFVVSFASSSVFAEVFLLDETKNTSRLKDKYSSFNYFVISELNSEFYVEMFKFFDHLCKTDITLAEQFADDFLDFFETPFAISRYVTSIHMYLTLRKNNASDRRTIFSDNPEIVLPVINFSIFVFTRAMEEGQYEIAGIVGYVVEYTFPDVSFAEKYAPYLKRLHDSLKKCAEQGNADAIEALKHWDNVSIHGNRTEFINIE